LKHTSRRFALMGTAALCASLLLPQAALSQDKLRVAIVMPGNITDKSWNQAGFEGLKRIESELGAEVAFSEKVAQPDQAEALSDFARRGYKVVFGHGGEFQEAVNRVAKRFPETFFIVNNGTQGGANTAAISFDYKQFGNAMGVIAARMSKTGKVGYIGGQKIKFSTDLEIGFRDGFKKIRPDGTVFSIYTNDWDDIAKGKEAALSQISQGADVVFPTMDNAVIGSLQAAKEKNAYAFGIYYDAIKDWPDTVLQSAILDIGGGMVKLAKLSASKSLKAQVYTYGIDPSDTSAARLGTFHKAVPEAVRLETLNAVKVAAKP
jgi:basic membrane protein A